MRSLIFQSLRDLKRQIEYHQEALDKASGGEAEDLQEIISWLFERGLNIIRYANPNEVSSWIADWFIGRK